MPAAALVLAFVAGCAAGPDFRRPDAPEASRYTALPQPQLTASAETGFGTAQRFAADVPLDARWWRAIGSPRLEALIDAGLSASPTLAAAQARLRQSEETYAARAGSTLYPQMDASLGAQRQRSNPAALGQPGAPRVSDLFSASLAVRYNFDLAGGNRRALEALAAQADYQRFRLAGARLTLAASIAAAAIGQARLDAQIHASEAILRAQEEQLQVARERVRLGEASPDDVLALRTQVEQTRAGIPALRSQHDQAAHLLAVLSGQPPGAMQPASFTLADFTLPAELPLVVPSELVRRRPDIQASEALLHSANAEYGAAVARRYPQLNLTANLGSQALAAGALFGAGSLAWGIAGQLTQSVFNPALPAERRAAFAGWEAAAASYQGVVLDALREVADVLRALEHDAQILAAQAAADASAQAAAESMQRKYGLGAASYLQVLSAQQQAQQSRIDLIAAQARRLADTVALYQALGGGWDAAQAEVPVSGAGRAE